MKKLMMALGVVAMAAAVQAATFRWYNGGPIYQAGSDSAYVTTGTAYLFAGNGQADLLSGYLSAIAADASSGAAYLTGADGYVGSAVLNGASSFGSTTVPSATITSGRAVWSETTSDTSRNYFQVLVDGDNIYIADTLAVTVKGTGNSNIQFYNTESKSTVFDASAGYQGGGWYAVPEPTSGLLMLLGMAGLALRRRRA